MSSQNMSALASSPLGRRLWEYTKQTGPGYMQSAMTLGGGTVASCAAMGSLMGYELLWVQPLAMLLGYFLLAAIAKQTCWTGERPYAVIWRLLHPSLAILWGLSAFVATILWHIPQYSLTANGVVALGDGLGLNLDTTPARAAIGAVALTAAVWIVYLYNAGAAGLKFYERSVKTLVWLIVFSFALVVVTTGVDWSRLFLGITGVTFLNQLLEGTLDNRAVAPIVGGIAAAVGINMVFLYPYSLLKKEWKRDETELAYFDLITGMAVPFILATGLMIIAVANTIGPAPGEAGEVMVRDIREIVPVLAPSLGEGLALFIIGLGMLAIGFSTIITHMLAAGFIGCEMFGIHDNPRARWLFSLAPAIGVLGVAYPFPVPLAITASTLAAPLMPVAVVCFLILLNMRKYMGEGTPTGAMRLVWNGMLSLSVIVLTINAAFALHSNWGSLQNLLAPEEPAAQSLEPGANPSQPPASAATPPEPFSATFEHLAMATKFTLQLYSRPGDTHISELRVVAEEAFAAIDDLESRISNWQPASQISRVNREAAQHPALVSGDILDVIELAREMFVATEGSFDITVGPILDIWGKYEGEGRSPSEEAIAEALTRVGMDKLVLDRAAGTVAFKKEGMRLDFGGIGKGLALDEAAEILRYHGVKSALLQSTSSFVAMGAPPGADYWTVALENPYNQEQQLDTVHLADAALSSSGCYGEQLETKDGVPYCHIVDPRTGRPVEGVLSVSVVAPTGAMSDALSTGFLVWGKEKIAEYCREHEDIGAVFVAVPEDGVPRPERINL